MDIAKSRMTGVYTLEEWHKDGTRYTPPQVEGRFVLLNGVIMTILYNRTQLPNQTISLNVGRYVLSADKFSYAYDEVSAVTESADSTSVSHKPLWDGMREFRVSVEPEAIRMLEEKGSREFVFANEELRYFEKGNLLRKWHRTADK